VLKYNGILLIDILKKYYKNKFVNDFVWTVGATIIVGVSALILQTLVGNYFNTDGLGIYSQVIAIYVILTAIANFGVEVSTLKHTSEFSDSFFELCEIHSASQVLIFIVSSIIFVLLFVVVSFYPFIFSSIEVAVGIKYILPGMFFFSLNKNSNAFLLGLRNLKLYSICRGVRWISILILTFGVLILKLNFNYLLLVYSLVEFLLFLFYFFKNAKYTKLVYSLKWYKIHFNYGITNVTTSIISVLGSNLIILISGYYLTKSETGIIAFMLTFTSMFFILSSSVQINFSPIFAKKWANNDLVGIYSDLKKLFRFTTITAMPLFLLAVVLYVGYINLFLLTEFQNTTYQFVILALGAIFTYMLAWPSVMLGMAGKIKQDLVRTLIISVTSIILSFLLIIKFGLYGSLLSYTLISILSVFISNYIIDKSINIDLFKVVKKCWF
jgi:O-antigen/teichoic acid export membrane protein